MLVPTNARKKSGHFRAIMSKSERPKIGVADRLSGVRGHARRVPGQRDPAVGKGTGFALLSIIPTGVSPRSRRCPMSHQQNRSCIEACVRCAQECEHCADACLGEDDLRMLAECIRLDRDCAALCWQAAAFMSRGSPFIAELCGLCAEACDTCAEECEKHDHDHCRRCAEACRACAEECRRMAGVPTA
jgi:Domain of Unknown Function (DUF326)